ncbi:unnamed protein product, partial [Prunus brigantina]
MLVRCHPLQRSSNSMPIHRQDEVGVRYCIKVGMVVLESIMMFLHLSPINGEVFKVQNTHQAHNLLLSSLSSSFNFFSFILWETNS